MKKLLILLVFGLATITAHAEECFVATGKTLDDAQTIRKKAAELGWKVGHIASSASGAVIKGKATLYPQDNVDVCLKEEKNKLYIKVQSRASDAGVAKYKKLPSKVKQ